MFGPILTVLAPMNINYCPFTCASLASHFGRGGVAATTTSSPLSFSAVILFCGLKTRLLCRSSSRFQGTGRGSTENLEDWKPSHPTWGVRNLPSPLHKFACSCDTLSLCRTRGPVYRLCPQLPCFTHRGHVSGPSIVILCKERSARQLSLCVDLSQDYEVIALRFASFSETRTTNTSS